MHLLSRKIFRQERWTLLIECCCNKVFAFQEPKFQSADRTYHTATRATVQPERPQLAYAGMPALQNTPPKGNRSVEA
mgnify:CR=1 FL=1